MRKIKRPLITACVVIACFLLESVFVESFSIASIAPNFMIIVTASFGFMKGKQTGMFVGLFSGLILDVFWGELLGFYALIYMLIGYINGFFKQIFYPEDIKLPLFLIGVSDISLGHLMYFLHFVMRRKFHYGFYLGRIILPELIYTLFVTLILYRIILKINQKLEEQERRSASKFV